MKGKKGGSFGAGKWLIVLVIYFMFFILSVNSVQNLVNADNLNSDISLEINNYDFSGILGNSYCSNPRFSYDPATGEKEEYPKAFTDRLRCEESIGVLDQSTCDIIEGCTWENVTSGFWFWETTESASCIGDINATAYGIEVTTSIFRPRVAAHNNTGIYAANTPFLDPTPCTHPEVLTNKTKCDLFSCSWEDINIQSSYTEPSRVLDTVGDLFTFRYDFGFDNDNYNYILNILTFVIPLLMLIVSIYYMLPFAHG